MGAERLDHPGPPYAGPGWLWRPDLLPLFPDSFHHLCHLLLELELELEPEPEPEPEPELKPEPEPKPPEPEPRLKTTLIQFYIQITNNSLFSMKEDSPTF